MPKTRVSLVLTGVSALVLLAGACSSDNNGNDPTGGNTVARAEAVLLPVISVDASGKADYQDQSGFTADRLDVEIEIDQSDFGAVGIDDGDGFADEAVSIAVTRTGTGLLPPTALAFSEDRRATQGDITFEVTLQGSGVPQFLPGDVARVTINGVLVLEGAFAPK